MRTFLGLILKLLATFVAAWIAYGLVDNDPLIWIFIVALVITVINYLIGDLLILPRYGNVAAAIDDGIMAGLIAYLISLMTDNFKVSWLSSLIFIVIIFIFELFLHRYFVHDED